MDRLVAHNVSQRGTTGPLLLFAHGLGGVPSQWDPIVETFASRARCFTFALAGSPGADPELFSPARHGAITGFADDLAAICAELGEEGIIYVGHSVSGAVGALVAAAMPQAFSQLVLINATARYVDDPINGYVGGFSAQDVNNVLQRISVDFVSWAAGFGRELVASAERPHLADEFIRTLSAYEPDVALALFRTVLSSDCRLQMSQVMTPTVLLATRNDPAVPLAATEWLAQHIAGASLQMLPSSGHFPHVVDPDSVIAALASVVDEATA